MANSGRMPAFWTRSAADDGKITEYERALVRAPGAQTAGPGRESGESVNRAARRRHEAGRREVPAA